MHIVQVECTVRNVQIYLSVLWQSLWRFYRLNHRHTKCNGCSRSAQNNFIDQIQCCCFFPSVLSFNFFFFFDIFRSNEFQCKWKSLFSDFQLGLCWFLLFFFSVFGSQSNVSSCRFYGWIKAVCLCMNKTIECIFYVGGNHSMFLVDDDVWYKMLCQQTCCCFSSHLSMLSLLAVAGICQQQIGCVCKRSAPGKWNKRGKPCDKRGCSLKGTGWQAHNIDNKLW